MQTDSDSYLFARSFNDVDDLAVQARQWQLDFRQLKKGGFRGEIQQICSSGVQLGEARFRCSLQQKGIPPVGMRTIAIPAGSRIHLKWRGREIDANSIMVFPKGAELASVSGPDFHVYTCSFPEVLLAATCETLGVGSLDQLCGGAEAVRISSMAATTLRQELSGIFALVNQDAANLHSQVVINILTGRIPAQVISSLSTAEGQCQTTTTDRRRTALQRAETFIEQHASEEIRVRDLVRVSCVSERTLEYAFMDQFGIGPKQFLNAYRLCMARRQLQTSDLKTTRVANIANAWGFWHMGQFAADYRERYEESPSDTLRRSNHSHAVLS
ncbi:transcriptional regulator EutR [Planctomycetes bacterium CA13]|uniref:Transcriptional regulator EutR n=1 Tax=Novipirellula herctigrandis TaxID=2527986 RepID=A0A5C5ZCH5_9BACT|nr:transcriptional regulator EutR [Planctomycetes bacterium CA13]